MKLPPDLTPAQRRFYLTGVYGVRVLLIAALLLVVYIAWTTDPRAGAVVAAIAAILVMHLIHGSIRANHR